MNDIDVTEFVIQLKKLIRWDIELHKHIIISEPNEIITNSDMMMMCSNYYGRKYDMLSYREKRLVREDVFRKLRGLVDG